MENSTQEHFKTLLEARLEALKIDSNAEARNIVTLDQQSVGRLSRMDALQQQAMAKATQSRREAEQSQVLEALKRVETGEYGYCDTCGEQIPSARLTLLLTATNCVSCG